MNNIENDTINLKILNEIFEKYKIHINDLFNKMIEATSNKNLFNFFGIHNSYKKKIFCRNISKIIEMYKDIHPVVFKPSEEKRKNESARRDEWRDSMHTGPVTISKAWSDVSHTEKNELISSYDKVKGDE